MTGNELALGGIIIGLLGTLGGGAWVAKKKVDKTFCGLQHQKLDELLEAKFDPIKTGIDEIKKRLDKLNGRGA